MNVIDKFYDLIDEACMLLNEKIKLSYFDALIRVSNDIVNEVDDSKLEDSDITLLQEKYDQVMNLTITNEEVRQAMQLLIIKAMKHINMNLEIMTPDYINYIIGYIINSYYKNQKKVSILDVEVGTGNLITTVANFIENEVNLIGVENNRLLINLCKANCELQNNDISLYFQDTLTKLTEKVDVAIGDLDCVCQDNKYYPYEIINNYLPNIDNEGLFVYLIENDFFNKEQINEFKKNFKGTLLGLIVLPKELFNKNHIGKSILVGSPLQLKNFEMMVLQMAGINEQEKFYNNINEIQEWIKKIKEIEK